ncbi:hypothetical protein AGMMS4957_16940 [Bacteroidia bacterium]|nr:hypothetical protein AGMMS4957_16940 [Bacteroidia bacterium]
MNLKHLPLCGALKSAGTFTQLWVLLVLLFAGCLTGSVELAFVAPAVLCAYFFSDNLWKYLHLDTPVSLKTVGLTILSVIAAYPVVNLTAVWNQSMVLPESLHSVEEWMRTAEDMAEAILTQMLYVTTVWGFLRNVLTLCLLAAIGEEFVFRGILTNILKKDGKTNPFLVIWIVAAVFSAIHIQFYGFVPRMLLGAYFGYLVYYTRSLWVPIVAHFTHNFISIAACTYFQDSPEEMGDFDSIGAGSTLWLSAVCTVLFALLFLKIKTTASPDAGKAAG